MTADLRFAFRSLLRTPAFTVIALVTLALGLGLNTAMFSMLNGFLLRPLAFPESDRLFRLDRHSKQQAFGDHSPPNFADLSRDGAEVAELAAALYWGFTLTEPGQPADTPLAVRVSANYFSVLRTRPALGRVFLAEEDAPGKNRVIVLGHRYWQSRFGGDPDIVGRRVRIDGEPVEIIGVMPPDGDTMRVLGPIGIYVPLALTDAERVNRSEASVRLIALGRYRDGVSPEKAAARFAALGQQLAADHPRENAGQTLGLRSLQSTTLVGTGRNVTFVLIGLSAFVLLIACANLANLLLTRALARAREFSIRAALGASRTQLIKPLVWECLVLALFGGMAAALVSAWTADWLASRFGDQQNPVDFSTDVRVLGFMIAASLLTALSFGVAPAWWAARASVNDALKSGTRGSTGDRGQTRYRTLLIAVQFALSLVLLTGAGLFLRGLHRLLNANAGWNPRPVISGVVNLASARYAEVPPILQFHNQLRERLLAHPGVANVAASYESPLFTPPSTRQYLVAGRPAPKPGEENVAFTNAVSASFADTVGLRLLRGRFFDETDQNASRPTVVINESMARALFPDRDPIGERIAQAAAEPIWAEIVGVVADTRPLVIAPSPIRFQVYKPFTQEPWQYATVTVRAADPERATALIETIRQAVAAQDPEQPIFRLMTVSQRVENNFRVWQTIQRLLLAFAGLGLLLAAIGIYGVITRLVIQRTGEIGIRMALGADRPSILRLVLGGGLRTAALGLTAGTLGAVGFTKFLTRVLPAFGGSPWEPVLIGSSLLFLVAAFACWLPARRATRVDPLVALRSE